MSSRPSLVAGGNYDGTDLSNVDCSGLDLRETSFKGANLIGATFRGCNLTGSNLLEALLFDTDFTSANLEYTSLVGAFGWDDVWEHRRGGSRPTRFDRASLQFADLSSGNFGGAVFDGADLSFAQLIDTRLTRARFRRARMKSTRIIGFGDANFDGCFIQDSELSRIRVQSMTGAELSNVNVSNVSFEHGLTGCIFENVKVTDSHFYRVDLSESSFNRCEFIKSWMENANFSRSKINESKFFETNLRSAQFVDATVKSSSFSLSNLRHSGWWSSHIEDSEFAGSDMSGCTVEQATLVRVQLDVLPETSFRYKSFWRDGGLIDSRHSRAQVQFSNSLRVEIEVMSDDAEGVYLGHTSALVIFPDGSQVNLENACISGLDFRGATFADQNLRQINFRGVDLSGCDFSSANLYEASFIDCDLSVCNFEGAHMCGVRLSNVKLEMTNMRGAYFGLAHVYGSSITNCDLSFADLTETEFSDTTVRSSTFVDSNLTGVTISKSSFNNVDLSVAYLERFFSVTESDFRDTKLSTEQLKSLEEFPGVGLPDGSETVSSLEAHRLVSKWRMKFPMD